MSWSSDVLSSAEEEPMKILFQTSIESSFEEPPIEEWSSLILSDPTEENPKMTLCREGLYDPGSGEICGKYISMSDSTMLGHVYYNYPAIKDPGIMAALLKPEHKKIYSYDGQELYLDLCEAMGVIPVRCFHRGLLNEEIDLKYYGVNPVGVRAMCLALVNNKYVKRLDLTSNRLNLDACYHLGQLLTDSFALQELLLSGCKIGPEGLRKLVDSFSKRTMDLLDLSKNDLGDDGIQILAHQIQKGVVIKRLNLSFNELTGKSGTVLAEAIKYNNTITHLDISWNKMYERKGSDQLLCILGESRVLTELNFAWNALTNTLPLREIAGLKTLKVLDLSNNRLSTAAVRAITFRLHQAKKLHILDLSHNQLRPEDALRLLTKLRDIRVKLQNLYMNDLVVSKEFIQCLREVLSLSYRAKTTITYGPVLRNYTLSTRDLKEIVMRRLGFVARPTKKFRIDIALFLLEIHKRTPLIETRALFRALRMAQAPVSEGLVEEIANCFPGPRSDTGEKTINLGGVVEYVRRLWPDKKLPPTPPPEPEPVIIIQKKKGKKDKKK